MQPQLFIFLHLEFASVFTGYVSFVLMTCNNKHLRKASLFSFSTLFLNCIPLYFPPGCCFGIRGGL